MIHRGVFIDSPLSYKIYLPSNIKGGEKYPVIYAMHGMESG